MLIKPFPNKAGARPAAPLPNMAGVMLNLLGMRTPLPNMAGVMLNLLGMRVGYLAESVFRDNFRKAAAFRDQQAISGNQW